MSERKTGSGERQDAEQPEAAQQNEPQGRTLKFPELPERRSLMGGVMFRKSSPGPAPSRRSAAVSPRKRRRRASRWKSTMSPR